MRRPRSCAVMVPLWLLGACQAASPGATVAVPSQDIPSAPLPPSPGQAQILSVNMQRMSDITRVLASEEFQGRSMGTTGEERTIDYLIEQFRSAGCCQTNAHLSPIGGRVSLMGRIS